MNRCLFVGAGFIPARSCSRGCYQAGTIPISAKLFFAEKAEKMNIEHRTSNIE